MSVSTVASKQMPIPVVSATRTFVNRSSILMVATAGLLAAAGGGVLLATSGHLADPVAYGAQVAAMIVGTVAAAIYWLNGDPATDGR
jgi:hypothetical protein